MLIAAMPDGLNLVAKEYVAARGGSEGGVLLLSEFTGASYELPEAVRINPADEEDMVAKIAAALDMSREDQEARMRLLWERIINNTGEIWSANYMNALERVHAMNR